MEKGLNNLIETETFKPTHFIACKKKELSFLPNSTQRNEEEDEGDAITKFFLHLQSL